MKRILGALALVLVTVSCFRAEAQILYAATGSNGVNGNLYTVDPATGVSTLVGPLLIGGSPIGLTGLAFHPATGVLFGATSNATGVLNPKSLVRINPATGAATLVGAMTNPVGDIAFDTGGTLYGWSATQAGAQSLFTINLLTAAQTTILPGDPGFPASGGNALSFSRGTLYLTANGAASIGTATGALRTVDPATGITTVGPTLTGAPQPGTIAKPGTINALATDPNKVLYGVDSSNGPVAICNLVVIDPATGAVTDHGSLPNDIDALAFSSPVVQTLYVATGSNGSPGTLYTVDPSTAASTPVGPTAINTTISVVCDTPPCPLGMTGLAFHPTSHVLYGVTGGATSQGATNPHVLVTIDPVTGDATFIGDMVNTVADITFDTGGTLFGWLGGGGGGLVTINLATAAETPVLPGSPFLPAGGRGLSFSGPTLYLTANGANDNGTATVTGALRTVNPGTGVTTVVATLTGAPNQGDVATINALASDLSDSLFGVNSDSQNPSATNLVSIDPATGVVTDHGSLPGNTDALAFTAVPDLAIAKNHSGNFFQGQTGATYSITVSNIGNANSSGTVTVTEIVPTGLTATGIVGAGWVCTQPSGPCTRSDVLPPNQSFAALTLTVNVANNAPSTVTNTATVDGGGDAGAANNTANDITAINTGPDPAIAKSHVGNFFQSQTGATYTITVTNNGQTATTGTVTVTDAVPVGLTATAITGTGWTCTQPSGPCTRNDALGAGLSYPALTLTVNVANNAPSTVTNLVTVSIAGVDVNPANNTATDLTTVLTGPDLVVVKSHSGNFTQGQTGATYTITASNAGQTPTSGALVTVTDAVPTGLAATGIAGLGWACTQPSGPCTRSDVLAGGVSYPALTLTVNVASNAPALVTNVATVAGGGDVNPANNTANDPTTVVSGIDLAITKTHTGSFIQGQLGATYTITVSNVGNAPSSGAVTVTDTVPVGLTATAIAGTGWACTQPSGPCTRNDVLGTSLSFPALTLTVNVASNAPPLVTNVATVAGGGDTVAGNNTANDPTTILTPTDLTITKTHVGNFSQGQIGATYTITVTNAGQAQTSGLVTVMDAVPAGLTATAISGAGWTCTQPSGPCTRSDALGGGLSYPALTLTVSVSRTSPASVTNTATVSGGGEVNTNNDTASNLTTIAGTSFFTVLPCRVLDTRNPNGPLGGPVLAAGAARVFAIAGTCNIPTDAISVSTNVTVTNPRALGFLQLFAGDTPAPGTSVLSFGPGKTRADNALITLSSDGNGTLAIANVSTGTVDVILDVNGYFK